MNRRHARRFMGLGLAALSLVLAAPSAADAQSNPRYRPKRLKPRLTHVFPGRNGERVAVSPATNQSQHKRNAAARMLRAAERARPVAPASRKTRLATYKAYKEQLGLKKGESMSRSQQKAFMNAHRHGALTTRLYPQRSGFRQSVTPIGSRPAQGGLVRTLASRLAKVLPAKRRVATTGPKPARESLIQRLSSKRTKLVFSDGRPGVAVRSTQYRFLGMGSRGAMRSKPRTSKPKVDLWRVWTNLWKQ